MTESGKLMTEVSKSLSDNLKNENKESGKTLSALKEVLGNAHDLTKVLVEGKTHGHLQVPSKPKRSKSTETKAPPPETSPSPDLSEEMTIPAWIKDEIMSMDRQNFEAYTECKGEHITIKTRVCGIDYNITMKILFTLSVNPSLSHTLRGRRRLPFLNSSIVMLLTLV